MKKAPKFKNGLSKARCVTLDKPIFQGSWRATGCLGGPFYELVPKLPSNYSQKLCKKIMTLCGLVLDANKFP
jgi:hypothetical protein